MLRSFQISEVELGLIVAFLDLSVLCNRDRLTEMEGRGLEVGVIVIIAIEVVVHLLLSPHFPALALHASLLQQLLLALLLLPLQGLLALSLLLLLHPRLLCLVLNVDLLEIELVAHEAYLLPEEQLLDRYVFEFDCLSSEYQLKQFLLLPQREAYLVCRVSLHDLLLYH